MKHPSIRCQHTKLYFLISEVMHGVGMRLLGEASKSIMCNVRRREYKTLSQALRSDKTAKGQG
jgi:hypothetical protein